MGGNKGEREREVRGFIQTCGSGWERVKWHMKEKRGKSKDLTLGPSQLWQYTEKREPLSVQDQSAGGKGGHTMKDVA